MKESFSRLLLLGATLLPVLLPAQQIKYVDEVKGVYERADREAVLTLRPKPIIGVPVTGREGKRSHGTCPVRYLQETILWMARTVTPGIGNKSLGHPQDPTPPAAVANRSADYQGAAASCTRSRRDVSRETCGGGGESSQIQVAPSPILITDTD